MFYWPGYRLSALLRALTALVSLATAFVLIRDLSKLIETKPEDKLKTYQLEKQVKQYEAEIEALKQQLDNQQG